MTKTILMIHGMFCGPWAWEDYKSYFESRGYNCRAITLRYHDMNPGDKPDPRLGTTSLIDYADDIEKIIRQLEEPPILMGHSMGSLIAQILAARGLAKAVVLLTPAAPAGISSLQPSVIRSFLSIISVWQFWKKPITPTFKETVYSTLSRLSPEKQRETFDKYVCESGRAISEIAFWLIDKYGASRVDRNQVHCPILVISASEDRITPASIGKQIAKRYWNADYKEFANHAHWVLSEPGWEEVADYAVQWLEQFSEAAFDQ